MKLKELLRKLTDCEVRGGKDLEITGICANSKLVAPGNLFIARRGAVEDGSKYIPEAISSGAIAILTDIYDPLLDKQITQVIHPNVTQLQGIVAAHYYKFPSRELFMVGITGTNGKTTTSFLVKHLLDTLSGPTGLIGTIKYSIGDHDYDATRTTPDVVFNHKLLREMVNQGCLHAVMEVTSHALDQGRVDQIHFDTAIFTNLTVDHLDYHKTMDQYCNAKNKLFLLKSLKTAFVNRDDPWWEKIVEGTTADVITYGIENEKADLVAENILLSPEGNTFTASYQGVKVPMTSRLSGRFNVYNALAAMGAAISRGFSLEQVALALRPASCIPGRLQKVDNPLHLNVYVDFAHTADALANVLECLTEFKKGRLITVFGCGGNRDASKRPKMAEAAEKYSDTVIVTSDNPRQEDPEEIIRQIIVGFSNKGCYSVEVDREKAIEQALEMATLEDIILIAGKGHESHQIFAHKTIPFDDRQVVMELCKRRAGACLSP